MGLYWGGGGGELLSEGNLRLPFEGGGFRISRYILQTNILTCFRLSTSFVTFESY